MTSLVLASVSVLFIKKEPKIRLFRSQKTSRSIIIIVFHLHKTLRCFISVIFSVLSLQRLLFIYEPFVLYTVFNGYKCTPLSHIEHKCVVIFQG